MYKLRREAESLLSFLAGLKPAGAPGEQHADGIDRATFVGAAKAPSWDNPLDDAQLAAPRQFSPHPRAAHATRR